ncbi:MAG: Na+/H+ antiporter subunit E [Ruminococcus sp.]|nr:Na+/H+ antiporter subunit E [Ruminococcus sp.]
MLLLFFCVWIIFNGAMTAEIAVIGAVIVFLMFAFICRFMDYSLKQEILLYKKSICLLHYILILGKEIMKANMAVLRLITSNSEVVEPVMVRVHTDLKSNFCRVLLANSITLTPGTITVSMDRDEYVIHCLDKSLSEGMEDSVFVKMLEKLERIGE